MSGAPDLVRVTAAPHPLRAATVDLEMPAGLTLAEIVEAAQPDPVLRRHCHVEIDGVPVARDKLHLIRPKPGRLVTIRVRPSGGGGGKDPLSTVLTIAVVAAAIAVSGGVLGPGALGLLGPSFGAGGFGALAAGAVIGGVGLALMPKPGIGKVGGGRVRDARDSPSQSIEGARNQANPWGVVPDVLGRHRMIPPYAAQPFTTAAGTSQLLHLMFAWTPGQVSIEDYRIGDTPVGNYSDVQIQTLHGTPSDDPALFNGIYANDIAEEAFSILLSQPDGYQTRVTETGAALIWVDFTFPQGLVKFDNEGKRQAHQVIVNVRYRAVGEAVFTAPPVHGAGVPLSWIVIEGDHVKITFQAKQTAALRLNIAWYPPAVGQYEVQVARVSADSASDQVFDEVYWSALRRAAPSPPVNFPVPLARTAVSIRASDQLNSVVDTFNAIVQRVAPTWDGSAWVLDATSDPAAMFRHVLQGPSNRRPVPDSQINLPQLQAWSEVCAAAGWECNLIVDFPTSVRELLQIICGTGRATLDNVDGKWSVVIDSPRTVPVQHFTPRNSRGFRAEKLFPERVHAWRVRFNDRVHDWRAAERIVYAPGFDAATATKFEQHDFVGVTSAAQAVQLATHQLRSLRLQPEEWDFEVDFEHLVAARGDLVLVTHDVLLVGLASGRIKALSLGGGGVILGMTSDETLPMEAGKSYGVSVRTVVNTEVTARVVTVAGDQTSVTFTPQLAAGAIAVGDLFGFGEFGAETVRGQVKRIRRAADLAARVTLLPYSDALFNWAMPPVFDPGMTPLFTTPAPLIQSIYTGGAALGREPDATLVRVVIECAPLRRADAALEAQVRPTETGENYRSAEVVSRPDGNIIVLGGMQAGETWDLRVRWVVGPLQPGPWAYRSAVQVEAYETATLMVLANLTLSAFGGQALLRWDAPTELDARFGGIVHFRHSTLQVGATWAASTSIGQGVPARNQTASLPLKAGTYLGRIFDTTGRPGAIAAVSTKQASAHQFGLLLSFDEHPAWAGSKVGTEVAGPNLQMDGTFRPGVGGFGNLGDVAINGWYDFETVVDLETVKRVRVTTHLVAASVAVDDLIDTRLDLIDNWSDFDGGDDQAEADAQVWVRITDDDPGLATSEWAWIDDTNWSDDTAWSDTPEGEVFWKLYQRLDSAEFEARGFDFQLRMASKDPAFNTVVSELRVDFEQVV